MKIAILLLTLLSFAGFLYANAKNAAPKNDFINRVMLTGGQPINGEGAEVPYTFTSVYPTDRSRGIYNSLQRKYKAGTIITPGYLRLDQSIQGTFTSVTFNVLVNQGTANNTERRLNITDVFEMTHIGVYLMKAGSTTAATQAEIGAAKLRSNNNALVFTGANEATALENFYNGTLRVVINSVVYLEAMDCRRFYRVETAQKGVGPAVITTDDGWPSPNYGMSELTPNIALNGGGKNDITVTFPNSAAVGGTNSQNFLVFYTRGFLCQNASKLNG